MTFSGTCKCLISQNSVSVTFQSQTTRGPISYTSFFSYGGTQIKNGQSGSSTLKNDMINKL